jgi:hypothetical protein
MLPWIRKPATAVATPDVVDSEDMIVLESVADFSASMIPVIVVAVTVPEFRLTVNVDVLVT